MSSREKHKQRSGYSHRKNEGLLTYHSRSSYIHSSGVKERRTLQERFSALMAKLFKKEKKSA